MFVNFDILLYFRKSIEKTHFYYFSQNTLTKITGTLCEDQYTFLNMSRSVLPRMRNGADVSCGKDEKHTFHIQKILSKIVPFMR